MSILIERSTLEKAGGYWHALGTIARERSYLLTTVVPEFAVTWNFISEVIEKGWSQYFALSDGDVVGWCDICREEMDGLTHSGHLGMGVIPGFRGQGLGRKLLGATMADALSGGLERIELEVFASNQPAINLYESAGFQEEGRKRRGRLIDGKYEDIVMMSHLATSAALSSRQ